MILYKYDVEASAYDRAHPYHQAQIRLAFYEDWNARLRFDGISFVPDKYQCFKDSGEGMREALKAMREHKADWIIYRKNKGLTP